MKLTYYGPRILLIICVLTISLLLKMDQHQHHGHDMMTPTPMSTDEDQGMGHQTHHNHYTHSGHMNAEHHQIEHHPGFFNFNWSGTILFESFKLDTKTGIFGLVLLTIIVGLLYEAVKYLRQYLHRDVAVTEVAEAESSDTTWLLADTYAQIRHSIKSREHFLQTLLYMVQMVCSYLLMLVVMTYNVWVVLTVLLALGAGFFVLGWRVQQIGTIQVDEPCRRECHTSPTKPELGKKEFRESELEPLREGMETHPDCDLSHNRDLSSSRETKL